MTRQEYMQSHNINSEFNLYKSGLITINGYDFFPSEITSFGNTNTKTYAIQPSRNEDFSMENINEIPTAEIPRLKINFDAMSLEVWKRMKLAVKPNEFRCSYYDWEYDRVVTHKMYFATQDDVDVFMQFAYRQEYYIATKKTIDIVATMNLDNKVTITYNSNTLPLRQETQSVYPNDLFYLSNAYTFSGLKNGYKVTSWNTSEDGTGTMYNLGMASTILEDLVLYAQWEINATRNLGFDYQNANRQARDTEEKNWITSKEVTLNSAVGELPAPTFYLTKNDALVKVGDLIGWWNIPYDWKTNGREHDKWLQEQITNSQSGAIKRYTNETIYNVDANISVFAHWLPIETTLTFDSMGGTVYEPLVKWYNANINKNDYLPILSDKTFKGWFIDKAYTTPFNWIMPAENITIYAKWE